MATTRLDGARDFVLVPVIHPMTMMDETVKKYTLTFLEKGYFISEDASRSWLRNRNLPKQRG